MLANEMMRFVKNTFPDLTIHEIHVNNKGWDNDILIINKEIVFRFPKSENLISKVMDEVKVLKCLRLKEPILQIPNSEPMYS
jgi:aminoglycoside 2''-phosphotransferase